MTDANNAAHLSAGDSLEIQMSSAGAARASNADVRDIVGEVTPAYAGFAQNLH